MSPRERPMHEEWPVDEMTPDEERPVDEMTPDKERPVYEDRREVYAATETAVVRPEPMMPPAWPAVDPIGNGDVFYCGAKAGRASERHRISAVGQGTRSPQQGCGCDRHHKLAHDPYSLGVLTFPTPAALWHSL